MGWFIVVTALKFKKKAGMDGEMEGKQCAESKNQKKEKMEKKRKEDQEEQEEQQEQGGKAYDFLERLG